MKGISGRLAWRLAWQGVRADGANTLFFVVAIFLAVTTLTAVLATANHLKTTIDFEAKALLGADLRFHSSHPFETFTNRHLRQAGREMDSGLEFSAMATGEKGGGGVVSGTPLLVAVRAVSSMYPLRGTVALSSGRSLAEVMTEGRVVVEQSLLQRMGLAIGNVLVLGKSRFIIGDTLQTESDQITRFMSLGPRVLMPMDRVEETGLIQKGSRIKYLLWLNLAAGESPDRLASSLENRAREAGIRLLTPGKSQTTLRKFMRRFSVFLGLTALLTLLLTGLAMGAAMGVHIRENQGVIATLKCLGADGWSVLSIYLWRTLIMAAPGALLGAVLGLAGPWGLLTLLDGVFPQAIPYAPRWSLGFFSAVSGLFFAFLFSLVPLFQIRKISPGQLFLHRHTAENRSQKLLWLVVACLTVIPGLIGADAIEEGRMGVVFVAGVFVSLLLVWGMVGGSLFLLARTAPRSLPAQLAFRGICRPGGRTVLVSLGVGLGLVFSLLFLGRNLENQIVDRLPTKVPSFFFIDILPHQLTDFRRVVLPFGVDQDSVRVTPVVRGRLLAVNGVPAAERAMEGAQGEGDNSQSWMLTREYVMTALADLPPGNRIVQGRWWKQRESEPIQRGISLEVGLAKGLAVSIGDTLTFDIMGIPITAPVTSLRSVRWQDMGLNFFVVFSPAVLDQAPVTYLSTVRSRSEQEEALFAAVTRQFDNVTAIASRQVMTSISTLLTQLAQVVRLLGVVAVVAGLLVLAVQVVSSRRERAKESAICRLMGATRWEMLRVLLIEFSLLGGIAGLSGLIVAHLLSALVVNRIMDDQWLFFPLWSLGVVFAGSGLVLLTGLGFAWRELGRPIFSVLLGRN
ncbi:MAG: ABC transporter permease [Magnetococcales bacterium]|nr:ABC transporter permease [Magnetococcales bacterium]